MSFSVRAVGRSTLRRVNLLLDGTAGLVAGLFHLQTAVDARLSAGFAQCKRAVLRFKENATHVAALGHCRDLLRHASNARGPDRLRQSARRGDFLEILLLAVASS